MSQIATSDPRAWSRHDPESEQYFYELFNIFLGKKQRTSEKRETSTGEGVSNNNIQMVQYAAIERGTLKSLSAQPSSPNDSLIPSPRVSNERCNPYIRPNPPPYTGPSNLAGIRADFWLHEEPAKTWFCWINNDLQSWLRGESQNHWNWLRIICCFVISYG